MIINKIPFVKITSRNIHFSMTELLHDIMTKTIMTYI